MSTPKRTPLSIAVAGAYVDTFAPKLGSGGAWLVHHWLYELAIRGMQPKRG